MSPRMKALIALIIASFFWATAGVASKALLKIFDPLSIAAVRLTIASLVILPFFLRVTPRLTKKLLLDVLPVSLFSAANFLLFLFGISTTTANASAIIYTATPLLVAFMSHMFIQEHISRSKIIGVLLGFAGVLIILLLPIIEQSNVPMGDIRGNLYILVAMCMFSLFTVGSRYLTSVKQYHPITVTGISMFISAGIFLLLAFILPHTSIFPALFEPKTLITIIYLAIFVTVLTYVLHQWAIKHTSATTGSLTSYMQPVFGFVINGILLGEVITGGFLIGSILVFAGTFIATSRKTTEYIRSFREKR